MLLKTHSLQIVLLTGLLSGLLAPLGAQVRHAVILHTNDFHSALDPIPAYWLPGTPKLGGAAQLSTLAKSIRAREKAAFLFDAGDMFTGTFSFLTKGEALMEMMDAIGYDALGIGNHEFDYGSANFTRLMHRVRFPVLGANIYYKGTDLRYSRPHVILERDGVRLGVIGIIGHDARSVTLASGIPDLEFRDPAQAVAESIDELEDSVDLIVVIAHQGKTGPMQTDAEAHADLQRDFDTDIELCGQVEGIDIFVGGHAHRGIEQPYVHPKTGSLIVQTYGYGTRLGYLKVWFEKGQIQRHEGSLLKVWSDELEPDPMVVARLQPYRDEAAATIGEVLGDSAVRLTRDYRAESPLGNLVTDLMRRHSQSEVALTNAGGLRADLPQGTVTLGNVLDALPFENTLVVLPLTGKQLTAVLEQGLTLERGMIQVSGLEAVYDLARPPHQRLISCRVGDAPLDPERVYSVATNSFLAEGGDLYSTFTQVPKQADSGVLLSQMVADYLRQRGRIAEPVGGRLLPAQLK